LKHDIIIKSILHNVDKFVERCIDCILAPQKCNLHIVITIKFFNQQLGCSSSVAW
jgi:hypothetical protein